MSPAAISKFKISYIKYTWRQGARPRTPLTALNQTPNWNLGGEGRRKKRERKRQTRVGEKGSKGERGRGKRKGKAGGKGKWRKGKRGILCSCDYSSGKTLSYMHR